MSRGRALLLALLAAAAGGALGAATRRSRPSRPETVEAVLAAVDRGDPAALLRALEAAGPPERYVPPWDSEVRMARAAATREAAALWRFVDAEPRGAAAARALALLFERAGGDAERDAVRARLVRDYPDSWFTRAIAGARR